LKILYAALRHNPTDILSASGSHFQFYRSMIDNGHQVKVLGPFIEKPYLIERVLKGFYRKQKKYKYLKYSWTNTIRSCNALNKLESVWKPDIVFSMTPSPLVFYKGTAPCIFRTDTTFIGMNNQGAEYLKHGRFMLAQMVWQEKKAFSKSQKIITHSDWSGHIINKAYNIPQKKIVVFANPAPLNIQNWQNKKNKKNKTNLDILKLLVVGREYHRKGIDIALEIVRIINKNGTKAVLDIIGMNGKSGPYYKFHGHFKKNDHDQLNRYLEFFEKAHFLVHPARFEASALVTSEAAAFGTPTITNATGGMETTVKNNISGIVLPQGSGAATYAKIIINQIKDLKRYQNLCNTTFDRYKNELNWGVMDKHFNRIIYSAANTK